VTLGYRDAVQELDDPDVRYKEFDFHHECELRAGGGSSLLWNPR
jgi:hypothetical protein